MRLVIKLGTSTVTGEDGLPDQILLADLATQIAGLQSAGHEILIISSGAIGCGRAVLGKTGPLDVPMRQACAAVGQHRLMQAWDTAFAAHSIPPAQVLLTADVFNERRRYVHLQECIRTLLRQGAVPVINENDVLSIAEIDATFTDNDALGALVAAKVEADLYIVLTDVEGLFTATPGTPGAQLVATVAKVTPEILATAGKAGTKGRGGMKSKLESAAKLAEAGVPSIIAKGQPGVLAQCLSDDPPGTRIEAVGRQAGMKRWLAAATPQGTIHIDAGAWNALQAGNQLLPAGVTNVAGAFLVESVVDLVHEGTSVGRLVARLSSDDLARCKGLRSDAVAHMLGIEGSVNVTRKGQTLLTARD